MLFWMIIKVALRSLLANKMRSLLAMLGIIIGVAAVIATLAIGVGAQQQVLARITAMGSNLIMVRPAPKGFAGVMSGTRQNLTDEDARSILEHVQAVQAVAPVVSRNFQIKYQNQNANTSVTGTTSSYLPIRDFHIDRGRVFSDFDVTHWKRVAVLGPFTANTLFGRSDPIGQTIKINGINFRVIGVMQGKGDQGWFNPDDQVFIPYTVAMNVVMGVTYLREIDVQMQNDADLDQAQSDITSVLRQRHHVMPGGADDVQIQNQAQYIEARKSTAGTFTVLLGTVGTISLLVGGIGIMNIMLVTVTERTREIGIRKAIGARQRDILSQFLVEAIIMSGVGGLVGAALGVVSAKIVGTYTNFATVVHPSSVALSLGFAAGVGIFFGLYPATRASQLDPIEALRYE